MAELSDATVQLQQAVIDRNLEAVRAALAHGADVHAMRSDGYTNLSFLDDPQIVKLLLDAGADPNQGHKEDAPDALFWAASAGRLEVIRLLVAAGATVEAELKDYTTGFGVRDWESSLHAAADEGHLEIANALLGAGGKSVLNHFNYVGHTPLMIAVERGDMEMAKLFITAGADVNARDEDQIGDTALKSAVESQGLEMIKLLLDAGADPRIAGWMGCDSFDKAKRRQGDLGPKILKLLSEYPHRRG